MKGRVWPELALAVVGACAAVVVGALEVVGAALDEAAGVVADGAEVGGAGLFDVVEVSGSTYCWSPAEVVVPPWASAATGVSSAITATARQTMIRTRPPTRPIEATTPV